MQFAIRAERGAASRRVRCANVLATADRPTCVVRRASLQKAAGGIVFRLFPANCNYAYLIMPTYTPPTRASNFTRAPNEHRPWFPVVACARDRRHTANWPTGVQLNAAYAVGLCWLIAVYLYRPYPPLSDIRRCQRCHPSITPLISSVLWHTFFSHFSNATTNYYVLSWFITQNYVLIKRYYTFIP